MNALQKYRETKSKLIEGEIIDEVDEAEIVTS
jgi:hypothetical protein